MPRTALLITSGSTSSSSSGPLPYVADATVRRMRPNGRSIATITIALDGTGNYSTFEDAFAAATTAQNTRMAAEGASVATPNYRVDILVKPGTYPRQNTGVQMVTAPPFTACYATDPTRGNTVVMSGFTPGRGFYWEGIDVVNTDDASGSAGAKYAFHVEAGATTIITRCSMTNQSSTSGGSGWPIGMDGVNGGTCVLHDCQLQAGVGGAGGRTNMHGDLSYQTGPPMTMVFSKCTYPGTIWYSSLVDTQADQMWVVDCTAGGFTVGGGACVGHFSGNSPGTHTHQPWASGNPITATDDTQSAWPIPIGGLSAADRAYYGMPA